MTAITPPTCQCGHNILDHDETADIPCWLCACDHFQTDLQMVPR